jgi:hypothetical protein
MKEMLRLFEDYKGGKSITVFDVYDTLVVTRSKITVTNTKTGEQLALTPQDFNTYKSTPHDEFDYSDFQDLNLLKAGRLIDWVFDILKRAIAAGKPVGIITARDNSELIIDFLEHNGVKLDHKYIFAVNDSKLGFSGSTAEKKRQAFVKFIEMGFSDFHFFDDDEDNIKIAKSIPKDFPNVKMDAVLIKKKWIPHFRD